MDNQNKETKDCCQSCDTNNTQKGFWSGLLMGLIAHSGCILFIVFTILGVTTLSAFFKPFLASKFSFYFLIILSFILTTISAVIYLNKARLLSWLGIKRKWKYLATLYGTTIAVNLILFLVIFPAMANWRIGLGDAASLAVINQTNSKLSLEVDIPCSGHSYLIIMELKKNQGISEVIYRTPDFFDVYYDSNKITKEQILASEIFTSFKIKRVE
jgi:hypothetical protein